MFCESIYKLDKYKEAMGSKKRQRSELASSEKPGGSSLSKTAGQPHVFLERSAQRLEETARSAGLNKRFRSSSMDIRVDSRSGSLSKDQINNEKDSIANKPVTIQHEERSRRLSAVGEGWDKKIKKKRSVGTALNRSTDSDVKGAMHTKLSSELKLAASDISTARLNANQSIPTTCPSTVFKGRISRAPRTGSVMAVNSSADVQALSEASEGWEQPTSTNKVMSLGLTQNRQRDANSSHTLGGWGGQRQQKSLRSRRTKLVSPVTNHEEGQISSVNFTPPGTGSKNSLNGTSGCSDTGDEQCDTPKNEINVEGAPCPARLSGYVETSGLEHKVEEKGTVYSDTVLNGKGKIRAFIFPTKRNKNFVNDNVLDGMQKQGRTMRGLSSSTPGISHCESKSENVSTVKPIQLRTGSDKIRSKSGRPPSKKMVDGRILTGASESNDDHEELMAAAASARKAGYLACSGRLWKKMEPIFGPISPLDTSYLKQQLSFADLDDGLSQIPGAGYNTLGIFTPKDRVGISSRVQESHSYQVVDKELVEERRSDKFSCLYQRVLSALIEDDDCEEVCNVNEGIALSFQCASDDSHCGSCNYADADTRDRDRLESEAESIVDFQIQRRIAGDRFSCSRSVTSNTTRNVSMSDSLHSSGRWLGDDVLSHSEVEFVSRSFQNDQGGIQADITVPGLVSDCQYQLMCQYDRLILELQSIGVYLDTIPDLAEGEVIDQEIMELKEGLFVQTDKKKHNLVKIDMAVQDDKARDKRYIEQLAMEQLIEMADKRRMACRRNNASKTVMRKVSKQVAMGFIERTLARCKTYELTGRSCFSDPVLQNVIFAPLKSNDAAVNTATDVNACLRAPKRRVGAAKAGPTSHSMLDSCIDYHKRGPFESSQTARHSSDLGYTKLEPILHKCKKRELLLDEIGGPFSRGMASFDTSIVEGSKGKRSERERDHGSENRAVDRFKGEQKQTLKPHQNSGSYWGSREMGVSSSGNASVEINEEEEEELIDFSNLPLPDFDSIEQLDISNDPGGTQDIGSWFDGLQEDGSDGLLIPMDDLSMIPL